MKCKYCNGAMASLQLLAGELRGRSWVVTGGVAVHECRTPDCVWIGVLVTDQFNKRRLLGQA